MSKKIEITADTRVRVLTLRGLKNEYYNGVPETWAECFGMRNKEDQNEPPFNRILFLRNVNICPAKSTGAMKMFLPVWHAAAITFKDEAPVLVLLISESALMDELVKTHQPDVIMKISYPKAKTIETQINLIDAEEKGIDNGASYQFPSIVYEGWPMKEWYENYQKTKAITENISKETGKSGQVDFTYTLDTEGISMQLHFVYLILDMVHEEFLWIQRDEMCLVEN